MKFASAVLAATLAVTTSLPALADQGTRMLDESPSAAAMTVDLLFVRPLSLVATVLGGALFIVQLPLAAIQGELPREPARKFVVEPFRYTFTRRLGSMEYSSAEK